MKVSLLKSIPIKLRQLRALCGYSQESLAIAWNMSQAAVSKIEAGKAKMSLERVEQTADFFNLSVEELLNDDIKTLSIKVIERQSVKKNS